MNNNIIEIILNKDKNTNYQCDFDEINNEYIITVEKTVIPKYCPVCNTKMYSKGIRTRRVRHPILNNGKTILIHLKQRSWICTNQMCKHRTTGAFSFVEKYNHHFKIDVDTFFLEKNFFEINDILPSIK